MAGCDRVPPQLPESTDFGPARPTLLSFPQELLDMILSLLSNDTVKSLRLTSKNFVAGANALLFRDLKIILPHDCSRVFAMSKSPEIARCVKQLTLIRLANLPDELLGFDHILPHRHERLPQWSRGEIEQYYNAFEKHQRRRQLEQGVLIEAWNTDIYKTGRASARFGKRCKNIEGSLRSPEESLRQRQAWIRRLEMALLKMPNLRSFVGPVDCSGTLEMGIPRSFQSDRERFAFVEFTGYVKGISALERYQLFFLMRFFGWRISFGKRLETIKVDFDCRLKDVSTDLKKIGWTKEDSQLDSLCFHGGEQYALFLDSVSRAKDVGISVYHGIDRSGIESGFLSGPSQELLCKAEQARNMDMRIISGIESAELRDIRRWWNEDLDIANCRIGLDMAIPKWQDLQSLRLSGIEALAMSMVHLLDSHVARLRELHLNKIALNRSKNERESVWWTIFKLIRKRTTARNLQTIHLSNLHQHSGYVKRPTEPSRASDAQRFISGDEFDLEYFSDGFVRRSEAYRLEVQQKIYDFILHRTDELPIEQDDWDFAWAHVEKCDANQNAWHCPHNELHEQLRILYYSTAGEIRFEALKWDSKKLARYTGD